MNQFIKILILCVLSTPVLGQVVALRPYAHRYTYDNAGNRIKRNIYTITLVDPLGPIALAQAKDSIAQAKQTEVMTFKVFPNPTDGFFQVSVEHLKEGLWLEIFDADGRQIRKLTLNKHTNDIDITDAGSGIFIMVCRNKARIYEQWKIVSHN
jgi:hypothetical protein